MCILYFYADKFIKLLSLKIVELELPKWYLQFGIQQVKSSATVSFQSTLDHHHHRHVSTPDKDAVNVHSLTAITELFNEVMEVYFSLLLEISYCSYIVESLQGKFEKSYMICQIKTIKTLLS